MSDTTTLVLGFLKTDGSHQVVSYFFVPEATAQGQQQRQNRLTPYQVWTRAN